MSKITIDTTIAIESISIGFVNGEIFLWGQCSNPRGGMRIQVTKEVVEQHPVLKPMIDRVLSTHQLN